MLEFFLVGSMAGGVPPFDMDHPGLHAYFEAGAGVNDGGAGDGDAIYNWLDQSGHERHLVRVDASDDRRATWSADELSGQPAVSFDGNDYIWCEPNSTWGTLGGNKTFFFVSQVNAADGGYIFDSYTGAARNAAFTGQVSAPEVWCLYDGSTVVTTGSVATATIQVHSMEFSNGGMKHWVDGELTGEGAANNGPMTGIVVGSRYNTANGLSGDIGSLIVFSEVLPSDERQDIEDWLNDRYNPSTCPDLDGNDVVNVEDLLLMLSAYGETCTGCVEDVNDSGTVDVEDLLLLIAGWGDCG